MAAQRLRPRVAGLLVPLAALVWAALAPSASAAAGSLQRTHGPDPRPSAAARVASLPSAKASSWCPSAAAGPDAHQVDNGRYRYRAVYAHASDAASRLGLLGGGLQEDAFAASSLLERQYGRAIRFDIGTPCGADQLDIAELRLPYTQAQLAALAAAGGTATFDAVVRALRQAGFPVAANDDGVETLAGLSENFLVWLDAAGTNGSCGQGTALLDASRSDTNLNNLGGKLALVFRNGAGFCGAEVVRHEIGHNLGALQPNAPHTTDGVHCTDAREDTMCVPDAPSIAGGPRGEVYFDYGNDDYWDPPSGPALSWWTLNLSRFLCEDANCNRPGGAQPPVPSEAEGQARRTRIAARRARARQRRARRSRVRLQRTVSRGNRQTRVRLRARGRGSARLTVRCRRSGPVLLRRRIAAPRTIRLKTRCRYPTARLSHRRPAARRLTRS